MTIRSLVRPRKTSNSTKKCFGLVLQSGHRKIDIDLCTNSIGDLMWFWGFTRQGLRDRRDG
jgi:hypothetical protein